LRSFIRWAGSKRLSLPFLKPFCRETSGRYIEPFAGSACLFFDLEPRSAILGDLNGELISAMRAIRRDVYRVIECVRRLPKGKAAYYRIRACDPRELSEPEAAARFLYLNRHCFNGLYRTNREGKFNVPFGPPKKSTRRPSIDEQLLIKASEMLRRATLLKCDFEETLTHTEKGDFVYLDPPYATDDTRVFSEYLPNSFSKSDLRRLGAALRRLDETGAHFLISYGDFPEARALLSEWKPVKIPTRRNIAGFAGHRKTAYELVATNSGKVLENAD
jgi:DNA adenine methylase